MWPMIYKNSPFRRHVSACFCVKSIFSYVSGNYKKTVQLHVLETVASERFDQEEEEVPSNLQMKTTKTSWKFNSN